MLSLLIVCISSRSIKRQIYFQPSFREKIKRYFLGLLINFLLSVLMRIERNANFLAVNMDYIFDEGVKPLIWFLASRPDASVTD